MNQSHTAHFQFVLTVDTDYDVLNFFHYIMYVPIDCAKCQKTENLIFFVRTKMYIMRSKFDFTKTSVNLLSGNPHKFENV